MIRTNKSRSLIITLLLACTLILAGAMCAYADDAESEVAGNPGEAEPVATEVQEEEPEEEAKNGILLENGAYYYYVDGVMQKASKFTLDGKTYFAKQDGKLAMNELLKIDGEFYYAGSDCAFASEIFKNGKGAKYFANEETNVVNTESTKFVAGGKDRVTTDYGQVKDNQFIVSGGSTYYCGANGQYLKGIIKHPNGNYYYADKDGKVAVTEQWVEHEGVKYRVTKGGKIATHSVIKIGNSYYWLDRNGKLAATTFIIVDIARQKLTFYKGGSLALYTGIVTGMDAVGGTPRGDFAVRSLARNINLTGSYGDDTWDSHVNYWIAFKGNEFGLHDADWRSSWEFNDPNRYHKNGSHGCVNMQYSAVQLIWNTLASMSNSGRGVPVIVM